MYFIDMSDFDTSQLRWWRCVAVDSEGKIRSFAISISTEDIYKEFSKVRRDLTNKNWRFIEARPVTADEQRVLVKLSRFRRHRQEQLCGLIGQHYSPLYHWPTVIFVGLLFLLSLLLVCLR